MGGQNHQPCGHYLRNSTLLSKDLSVARSELEFANIALEDLILKELDDNVVRPGSVKDILLHLELSEHSIDNMVTGCKVLRNQMNEYNFSDLPTLYTVDLTELGYKFSNDNIVNHDSWVKISEVILNGGFYSVISFFEENINDIKDKTTNLLSVIKKLDIYASKGEVNLVLEENRIHNIKRPFAVLYTKWTQFQNDFLASSLLSTEVWYAYMNYGSICNAKSELSNKVLV